MPIETSIVIRTLNEAKHLENLLRGIHDQNYKDWEIVLVDSGSTDGTLGIAQRYGANIHHIPSEEFTFGRSLNLGCQKANGRYLVFASGHVWPVSNSWLRNLTKPFEEPSIGMIYGQQRGTDVNSLSELRDLYVNYGPTSKILVDEPNGNNGNAAIRRDLWLRQPFDESLPGLEDIDWARKIQVRGYRVYYAADAAVYHVHEENLKQVYRRYQREAIAHKRMFPGYRFTRSDLAKGLAYAIVRDLLYAQRSKQIGKVFQVPGTRVAEYLGTYNGTRWHMRRSREAVHMLGSPQVSESVVIDGSGRHSLRETEVPEVGLEEVLIQVAYVGVCAFDFPLARSLQQGASASQVTYPMIPGHEFAGVVLNTGANVSGLKKGQKVVGECSSGAYSRYLKLPARYVYKLPDDIPLKNAALIEPVVACLRSLRAFPIEPGHRVCVVGAGPMGNLCAQLLRHKGFRVSVVDRDERRLNLLHKYDMDTLAELEPLNQFDYCLQEADDHGAMAPGPTGKPEATAAIFCSGLACHPTSRSADLKANSGPSVDHDSDWQDAIRLVRKGLVNLDDHTVVVEPLEAYQRAWEAQTGGKWFKVLLSADRELEDL